MDIKFNLLEKKWITLWGDLNGCKNYLSVISRLRHAIALALELASNLR